MPRHRIYKKKEKQSPKYARLAGAGLFLLLWSLLSRLIGSRILLPGPWDVLRSLCTLLGRSDFWLSLGRSLGAIAGGYLLALVLAVGMGTAAFCFPKSDILFAPLLRICQSAPLAALTIILMIWLSASSLPFVLILLAVTPPLYASTKTGLEAAPDKLLEMAFVFRFRRLSQVRYIYLPSLKRQLLPTLEFTAGLAWKAGITGEILALPASHLGTKLYEAKIQLESAEVLALLAVIVLLSRLLAGILLRLLRNERQRLPESGGETLESEAETPEASSEAPEKFAPEPSGTAAEAPPAIILRNLSKEFDGQNVLDELSAEIPAGKITVIAGPSGRGKTTLFRILLGLLEPDSGEIIYTEAAGQGDSLRYAASFQDGRLLETISGLQNLLLAGGPMNKEEKQAFCRRWSSEMEDLGLLPEQPVAQYSGGMKQKLSLLRTLAAPSDILILDEVFREVDEHSEEEMIALLERERGARTVLMATHKMSLAERLGDAVIILRKT